MVKFNIVGCSTLLVALCVNYEVGGSVITCPAGSLCFHETQCEPGYVGAPCGGGGFCCSALKQSQVIVDSTQEAPVQGSPSTAPQGTPILQVDAGLSQEQVLAGQGGLPVAEGAVLVAQDTAAVPSLPQHYVDYYDPRYPSLLSQEEWYFIKSYHYTKECGLRKTYHHHYHRHHEYGHNHGFALFGEFPWMVAILVKKSKLSYEKFPGYYGHDPYYGGQVHHYGYGLYHGGHGPYGDPAPYSDPHRHGGPAPYSDPRHHGGPAPYSDPRHHGGPAPYSGQNHGGPTPYPDLHHGGHDPYQGGHDPHLGGHRLDLNYGRRHYYPGYLRLTDYRLQCGGTLITDQVVLTAAHCVKAIRIYYLLVTLGDLYLGYSYSEVLPHIEREVSYVLIHEDYDPGLYKNDLALLLLEKPVQLPYTPHIGPACLPPPKFNFGEGKGCIVVGWGKAPYKYHHYDSSLAWTSVSIYKGQDCSAGKKEFCIVGEDQRGACKGDAGGAVLCPVSTQEIPDVCHYKYCAEYHYFVAGVISRGPEHCSKTSTTVVVDILDYIGWIYDFLDYVHKYYGGYYGGYSGYSSFGLGAAHYDGNVYGQSTYGKPAPYGEPAYGGHGVAAPYGP